MIEKEGEAVNEKSAAADRLAEAVEALWRWRLADMPSELKAAIAEVHDAYREAQAQPEGGHLPRPAIRHSEPVQDMADARKAELEADPQTVDKDPIKAYIQGYQKAFKVSRDEAIQKVEATNGMVEMPPANIGCEYAPGYADGFKAGAQDQHAADIAKVEAVRVKYLKLRQQHWEPELESKLEACDDILEALRGEK